MRDYGGIQLVIPRKKSEDAPFKQWVRSSNLLRVTKRKQENRLVFLFFICL